jgi:hypothetical protein
MSLTAIFRLALIASLVISIVGSAVDFVFPSLLPAPLQEYLKANWNAELEKGLNPWDLVILIIGIPFLLLTIASYIGLFLWKNWARQLCLILAIIGCLMMPFLGAQVYSALAFTLYSISSIIGGLILGMLYFSPIAEKFARKAE